jgi:hypothetical protein
MAMTMDQAGAHTPFGQLFGDALRKALAEVDTVRETLERERDVVAEELAAARELHRKAEREGERVAQEYFDERRAQLIHHTRYETVLSLAVKHLAAGASTEETAHWLDADAELMERAATLVQRRVQDLQPPPGPHNAILAYTSQGRGGNVLYRDDRTSFNLWWEFAMEPAVAIIGIPNTAAWEKATGISLEERSATLEWIAHRALHDQVPNGGVYRVAEDHITLYGHRTP